MYSANSLSAATKIFPLSLIIFTGLPLRARCRIIAFRQLSGSSLSTISICIARIVRHAKKQHQRFSLLRSIFTLNSPKKSTPTFVNTVDANNHSSGRSVIIGDFVCALLFRHVMYFFLIDLTEFCMLRIQKFC